MNQSEDVEDPDQVEVQDWLTATNKQIHKKYRTQYAQKIEGKRLDKKNPQSVYSIKAGFVTNLNDGTKRPVAYLDHNTIAVFSDGGARFKGRLDSQGNVIVWGPEAKWYRNLAKTTEQRSKDGT